LDYGRRFEFASTSEYFRAWIEFRKSDLGSLVRHFSRAMDGFFEFERAGEGNALVCLYNADRSQGQQRLLFAINPDLSPRTLSIEQWKGPWTQLADRDRFWGLDSEPLRNDVSKEIAIPPLGCGLWLAND
jgi:pullulanase